jgi:hypothetical protein
MVVTAVLIPIILVVSEAVAIVSMHKLVVVVDIPVVVVRWVVLVEVVPIMPTTMERHILDLTVHMGKS